ncbi:MAG: YggS family pyridoxal phosphate-dependent enzyme [Verrucomicrobiota bacterium]|nr:YggS family pyridoxal phosphate-dependent enzyme [Verrucomicrobiota bacterium]
MNPSYDLFANTVAQLLERIQVACVAAGRLPGSVKLMAVTKTLGPEAPFWAARAGLGLVGENRVQEAVGKRPAAESLLKSAGVPLPHWELIGHLQSNKCKLATQYFDRVQSVESEKLIMLLNRISGESGRKLPILLQINAGRDPAKFGADIENAPALCECALNATHLRLEGLMTIAPLSDDPSVAERTFANLATIRDELQRRFSIQLPELSMGMSGDFPLAIKHGSTLVRVGTALYGSRDTAHPDAIR